MSKQTSKSNRTYQVTVEFFSAGERYGSETYTIEAIDRGAASLAGLDLSEESVYDDPRIPDLTRTARARLAGAQ